jgi:hypothetical protein
VTPETNRCHSPDQERIARDDLPYRARSHPSQPSLDKPARRELPGLSAATLRYIKASSAPNTVRAYEADLKEFNEWCAHVGVSPLPATPTTVANYISRMAD